MKFEEPAAATNDDWANADFSETVVVQPVIKAQIPDVPDLDDLDFPTTYNKPEEVDQKAPELPKVKDINDVLNLFGTTTTPA